MSSFNDRLNELSNSVNDALLDISDLNKKFGSVFPNQAIRFRGFSSTDPSTGVITLNGIRYGLNDFSKENNGDVFYYRDVIKTINHNNEQVDSGIIYAYIYINNSLIENRFIENDESENYPEFRKFGYGFYNNLSTLIVDNLIADDAKINPSKIDGLPNQLSTLRVDVDELKFLYNFFEVDVSAYIEMLSGIVQDNTNSLSSFTTKPEVNQISSSLLSNFDNYLNKNSIISAENLNEINKDSINTVPSIKTLNGELKGYSIKSHTHDDLYSQISHKHDDLYSQVGHTHDIYSLTDHSHQIANINGLSEELESKSTYVDLNDLITAIEKNYTTKNEVKSISSHITDNYVLSSNVSKTEKINLIDGSLNKDNIIPSVKTLSGTLEDYTLKGHSHNISDINELTSTIDDINKKIDDRVSFTTDIDTTIPFVLLDTKVPSTKLFKQEFDKVLSKNIIDELHVGLTIDNSLDTRVPSSKLVAYHVNERVLTSDIDIELISDSNVKVPSSKLINSTLSKISSDIATEVDTDINKISGSIDSISSVIDVQIAKIDNNVNQIKNIQDKIAGVYVYKGSKSTYDELNAYVTSNLNSLNTGYIWNVDNGPDGQFVNYALVKNSDNTFILDNLGGINSDIYSKSDVDTNIANAINSANSYTDSKLDEDINPWVSDLDKRLVEEISHRDELNEKLVDSNDNLVKQIDDLSAKTIYLLERLTQSTDTIDNLTYQIGSIVLDKIYPVGTIYTSINNVNPSTYLGGTWEAISSGKFLQQGDGTQIGGTEIEAGLPNLSGSFDCPITFENSLMEAIVVNDKFSGSGLVSDVKTTKISDYSHSAGLESSPETTILKSINYDASKGSISSDSESTGYISKENSPYGKSNTVQPASIIVYMWKRTK